jgi:hypothetical protein
MIRYIFFFILVTHGLIHMMGFAKAFGLANLPHLKSPVTRQAGSIWLFATMLFLITAVGFLLKKEWWPVIAVFAVVVSQVIIILSWKDARFGSVGNLIIFLVAVSVWGKNYFESQFIHDVKTYIDGYVQPPGDLLTEADIQSLPPPVQHYLKYSGAVGKPKVKNLSIHFDGEMRGKAKDWFPFTSIQYDFFDDPTRLFFIKGKMYGLTVPGYHDYQHGKAKMNIRLFGLIPVIHEAGAKMDKTETVTYFNDLCLFAPAALVDKRISWKIIDSSRAEATFTNGMNTISATLLFNETGQLVNFISDDRSPIDEVKQTRFSTPVKNYKAFDGRNIPTYGETIWHYPDGDFVYGRFYLRSIDYNVSEFKN